MKPEEFGQFLADQIKAAIAPVVAKQAELEALGDALRKVAADLQAMVQKAVAEAVAAQPPAVGLADAMADQDGNLVLVLSNGTTKTLGRVIAKDGEPGKHGLAFDEFTIIQDDARPVLRFVSGGREAKIPIPGFVYRGIWAAGGGPGEGGAYEVGDSVTLGGSQWIAKAATDARPGQSEDWQMAVQRGRDARMKGGS